MLYYEDFPVDSVVAFGAYDVTAEDIIAFAEEFDPQPFHLDAEAAKHFMAGGLIASGWHTAAILMRMSCDHFVNDCASEGGSGVDEIKWLLPVRPGDRLSARRTVTGARLSRSKPRSGVVDFFLEVLNHEARVVMTQTMTFVVARRDAA